MIKAVEADDGAFSGRVVGLRAVITFEGDTYAEVEQAFRASTDDYPGAQSAQVHVTPRSGVTR